MRVFIVFGIFFSITFTLNGQSWSFKHYTTIEGLSQLQVTSLVQDREGYIWIATKDGLNRFDGVEFESFGKNDGLPSSNIPHLFTDKHGVLWVIAGKGLSRFNGKRFDFYPINENVSFNGGVNILNDGSFRLWAVNSLHASKILTYKFFNGKYSIVKGLDSKIYEKASFYCTNDGKYFIFYPSDATKGFYEWADGKTKLILTSRNSKLKNIKVSQTGSLFMFYSDSIFQFKNGRLIPFCKAFDIQDNFLAFLNDSSIIGVRDFEIVNYTPKGPVCYKWCYDQMVRVLVDKENTIWIGTEFGLYRIISQAFENYGDREGVVRNVWSIVEDNKKNIWFASFGYGLQKFDGVHMKTFINHKEFIDNKFYMGSSKLADGSILFTHEGGLVRMKDEKFTYLRDLNCGTTLFVYQNPIDCTLLISSISGLIIKSKTHTQIFTERTGLKGNVIGITSDSKGNYWFAEKGLVKYDGKKLLRYGDNNKQFKSFNAVVTDTLGYVWAGSSDGLFRFDGNKFVHVCPASENLSVNFLIRMNDSLLLAGSRNKLVIVNVLQFNNNKPDYYKILGEDEGFQGMECGQNGVTKDSKGRFWIVAADRVVCFNPLLLTKNSVPPRVYFKKMEVLSEKMRWIPASILSTHEGFVSTKLELTRHQKNIRIWYTGISTKNPEKVVYKYRLEGYNDLWSQPSKERNASFFNLKPGNYKFEVLAANADGVWNSAPATFEFVIIPAFWQTILFKIVFTVLLLALITGSVYTILKFRENKREERRKLTRDYSRAQMGTIIQQFDPHFTFNVISSVGSLIYSGDRDLAYHYFVKLSGLLRSALNEHEKLTKPLKDEIEFVKNYCDIQKFRYAERFDFEVTSEGDINWNMELPKMLVQNFVENAIKHGIEPKKNGGYVKVKLVAAVNSLIIEITDNGIGRTEAKKRSAPGTHKGQKITSALFELMNNQNQHKIVFEIKDLYSEDQKPAGTSVIITIPNNFDFTLT